MDCVVCNEPLTAGREHYSNAWERTQGRFPCCSDKCSSAFHPDQHWIPAVMPSPASDDEQRRMLEVTRRRVRDGDKPRIVLREMLLAGISPRGLRKILIGASVATEESRKNARRLGIGGAIAGVLTGHWSFFQSTDKRDPNSLEEAQKDLDQWEARLTIP